MQDRIEIFKEILTEMNRCEHGTRSGEKEQGAEKGARSKEQGAVSEDTACLGFI